MKYNPAGRRAATLDAAIEKGLPRKMADTVTFKTRLIDKVTRGQGTMSFRFEKPSDFVYAAGQWFMLTVPGPDGSLKKPFTYSSSPTESFLEFTTRLSGSSFKNALLAMELGVEVEMRAAMGSFVLKDGVERMACLIGGVGVTPVRSMLRSLADAGVCDREIVVFYGNTSEDAITFKEELEAIRGRLPQVRIVHVLSRAGEEWEGHRGHINNEVVTAELGEPGEWTYYLCGPPPMAESMQQMLAELEVPASRIVMERFGPPRG